MRAFAILAILLLVGCTAPPPQKPQTKEDTLTIAKNGIEEPSFGAKVPIRAELRFDVTSGGPIDVWLANLTECRLYGQRSFDVSAAALNTTNGSIVAHFPPGDDCIMFDNGPFAKGKANATGPATVHYVLDLYEEPNKG